MIPLAKRESIARSFNSDRLQSLADQWELVIVHALQRVGKVNYEPNTGGSSRLDALVHFDTSEEPLCVIAVEVTAVSDEHVRDLNPLDQLMEAIYKAMRKLGLPPHGLDLEIGSRLDTTGKKTRVVLALPTRSQLSGFVKSDMMPFLRAIAADRSSLHQHCVNSDTVQLQVHYQPGKNSVSMSYGDYEADSSLTDNSFARALSKKAEKVRRSGFLGPVLIAICDAGAPLFEQRSCHRSITPAKVVDAFLVKRPEVAGVAILYARSYEKVSPAFEVRLNPAAAAPFTANILDHLKTALSQLPPTTVGVRNARYILQRFKGRRGLWLYNGGASLRRDEKGREIVVGRISAKELVSALAGSTEDLAGFVARQLEPNVFRDAKRLGDRLVNVRLVHLDDEDDDWLEFEFQGKDPGWSSVEPG